MALFHFEKLSFLQLLNFPACLGAWILCIGGTRANSGEIISFAQVVKPAVQTRARKNNGLN